MSVAYEAMVFARDVHRNQVRKYTGNQYSDHLAEVAGIVATIASSAENAFITESIIATAWLHDCVEDCGVSVKEIESRFGFLVAVGVSGLSDVEKGNRAERKRLSRERLALCAPWIQTIKCADMISNTSSIVKHDPEFAKVYMEEKRLLLQVLTKADNRLRGICLNQLREYGANNGCV